MELNLTSYTHQDGKRTIFLVQTIQISALQRVHKSACLQYWSSCI